MLKTTRSKTEEQITNNISTSALIIKMLYLTKYTGQKQVYIKLNKAKLRIINASELLMWDVSGNFYLTRRCLNIFLGWLYPLGLLMHFPLLHCQSPLTQCGYETAAVVSGVLTLLKYPYPRHVDELSQYERIRLHVELGYPATTSDHSQRLSVCTSHCQCLRFHISDYLIDESLDSQTYIRLDFVNAN